LRASDNPIAMACFGFVTFFPLPDLSLPSFISRISRSTDLLAAGLYLRELDDFFDALFFEELFFADEDFFAEDDFFDDDDFLPDEDFFEDEDFFPGLFFFVAIARVPPRWLGRAHKQRGCRLRATPSRS
jgi:hypothetical protein